MLIIVIFQKKKAYSYFIFKELQSWLFTVNHCVVLNGFFHITVIYPPVQVYKCSPHRQLCIFQFLRNNFIFKSWHKVSAVFITALTVRQDSVKYVSRLRQSAFDLTAKDKALCWIVHWFGKSGSEAQQSCIRLTSMRLWLHILT